MWPYVGHVDAPCMIPGKEQIQTRVVRYPKTLVRISKHVCLEINLQKNAVLKQMLTNFQEESDHPSYSEPLPGRAL